MSNKIVVFFSGSREFKDYPEIDVKFQEIIEKYGINGFKVIHGNARGVDRYVDGLAKKYGVEVKNYPANWNEYGKKAGYIRNEEMARLCNEAYIFWDGVSNGTKHSLGLCKKFDIPFYLYNQKEI